MTGLDELLRVVAGLGERRPAATQPPALDALFAELREPAPLRAPQEIEEAIWSLWSTHPDPVMARRLELATTAIGRGEYGRAERLLDPLIAEFPHWAEAWNQRATLRYLDGRDAESIADIGHTLALEPRHFGALCGLAQVCLRRGEHAAALVAFEAALAIHPHLAGVGAAVDELRAAVAAELH